MSSRRFLLAMSLLLVAACAVKTSSNENIDAQDEADSTDANASSAQASHFTSLFTTNLTSTDPGQAASDNAPTAAAFKPALWPAGCETRTKTSATEVTVTLDDCTGPFGLVHLNGTLTATFTPGANGALDVQVASQNLTANGQPVTESGSGDVTLNGSVRTVTWSGEWDRVNAKGETVQHQHQGTIAYDASTSCVTTIGTATTSVGVRAINSSAKSYEICKDPANGSYDLCPSGEVTFTREATGATLTVDFDGSAEAKVTGPKGNSIEVPLVCVGH